MKIYYSVDEITDNCNNRCPFLNIEKDDMGEHIGSVSCKTCKYCYGASSKKYPDYILVGNKDGKTTMISDKWIKCDYMMKKSFKIKIQKLFYNIKRKALKTFGLC